MTTISIELPTDVFSSLRRSPTEFASEMRMAAAIHWYQQATVSMERAAEIAGLSRMAFIAEMARRGIDVFHVDVDDLRRELANG